jgi:hypothetical protein
MSKEPVNTLLHVSRKKNTLLHVSQKNTLLHEAIAN